MNASDTSDNLDTTTSTKIGIRQITGLDRLVQILEISFIFLLIFSLIALFDTVFQQFNLYNPLSQGYLGRESVGSLNGGHWVAIVRITLIFNLLLFGFSLIFGLWMRRTRDGWTWDRMGYTLSTEGYSFKDLIRRGTILGIIAIIIMFLARVVVISIMGMDLSYSMTYFLIEDGSPRFFTPRELNAEYYFGIVEMGFIWPLSAGFFFFAYCHTSLNARFPTGWANVLSTFFYVFYLQFFFLIPQTDKISRLIFMFENMGSQTAIEFWISSIALWIILYINFAAFAETGSIVLPFLMNFVFNVGLTLIQAGNTLIFTGPTPLLFISLLGLVAISIGWYILNPEDFSTIRLGFSKLDDLGAIAPTKITGYVSLFVVLSFLLPGVINEILFNQQQGDVVYPEWLIPSLYAVNFILLILLATIILTYEPTEIWDVLLLSNEGVPIASKIELFETDDVLISGFFAALQAVDKELSAEGGLTSIKRGQREILIEDGVFTRIIALADRDLPSIRQMIQSLHRKFEISVGEDLPNLVGKGEIEGAANLVNNVSNLEITFSVPTQTRWISSVSLILAPIMIGLIGLI